MQNILILKPSMDETVHLHPFVSQAAEAAGIDSKGAKRLRLAVDEAVANVINYGQASAITLCVTIEADELMLTIDDDGVPFDPTQGTKTDLTVPADERPPGGMGIILMHQMTDSLSYRRAGGHNILRMGKRKN